MHVRGYDETNYLPKHDTVQADLGWNKPIRLQGIKVKAPPTLGGNTLAEFPSISTTDRLWSIALGRGFDAFAPSPWIDCSLASSGQLKWKQLLDYVGSPHNYPQSFEHAGPYHCCNLGIKRPRFIVGAFLTNFIIF